MTSALRGIGGGWSKSVDQPEERDPKIDKKVIYAVSSPTCLLRELDGDRTLRCEIVLLVS